MSFRMSSGVGCMFSSYVFLIISNLSVFVVCSDSNSGGDGCQGEEEGGESYMYVLIAVVGSAGIILFCLKVMKLK